MVLHNVHIMPLGEVQPVQLHNGNIAAIGNVEPGDKLHIEFDGAIAFPGLINSHDHLDFNNFPNIGNRIYNNYTEWGNDIHAHNKPLINAVLNIPQQLRTRWGLYKNMLNGITTVVNHGEWLDTGKPLINVFQQCVSLHSVKFEKKWKWKLSFSNNTNNRYAPVVIHAGEGTDAAAFEEINELLRWNFFKKDIIAVHGVAMNEAQAAGFKALVWCPASNYFLLNKTANVQALKTGTTMLFGTDSTLTASWDIWSHLRQAGATGMATDEELYNMVTATPAKLWDLNRAGVIEKRAPADIVVARHNSPAVLDSFFNTTPADILLVIHDGNIRMFDASLLDQLQKGGFNTMSYGIINIGDSVKYVEGGIVGLIKHIKHYSSEAYFAPEISF